MPKLRIYIVENNEAETLHLVNASSQAAALRHVVKQNIKVRVASQQDCIEQSKAGKEVENAK